MEVEWGAGPHLPKNTLHMADIPTKKKGKKKVYPPGQTTGQGVKGKETKRAMGKNGLITYRKQYLMYIPEVSTPESRASVTETISHELAHQWFGNLVTPMWWDDLWLNEGFATYISFLGVDHAEPTWKVLETSIIQGIHGVFSLDSLESSHKISVSVNHPDEIAEVFDGISYQKGASIIRMMTHYLTEATFRKGLTNYLKALAYKNAVQDDLWKYLTLAAHEDGILPQDMTVKMIMDTWTLQKGYPVIHVKRSLDGTSAILTQERFLVERSTNSSNSTAYKWWVPLTYTTQSEANFNQTQAKLWMKDSEDYIIVLSLPPTDQWVIFNLQETGYYRVNYDDHNWNLIIQQLKKDHRVISPINRAQIINDAMNVAKAGTIPVGIKETFHNLGKEKQASTVPALATFIASLIIWALLMGK
ncbi:aminopeptidase N-like [Penaeus monodon]|uniref:aminopeptidase N-like n=1 Tax=Penaeus monodon TaxID=6687 RepID=UPI0018A7DE48|nr:aminopeptidase N-like [Penaeus monodon]